MKIFYAKYIPVPSELKIGDTSFWEDNEGYLSKQFFTVSESNINHSKASGWKKYNLAICMSDIKPGVKFTWGTPWTVIESTIETVLDDGRIIDVDGSYFVIEEIVRIYEIEHTVLGLITHPNVKHGQLFNTDELGWVILGGTPIVFSDLDERDWFDVDFLYGKNPLERTIEIKCKCCEKFS